MASLAPRVLVMFRPAVRGRSDGHPERKFGNCWNPCQPFDFAERSNLSICRCAARVQVQRLALQEQAGR